MSVLIDVHEEEVTHFVHSRNVCNMPAAGIRVVNYDESGAQRERNGATNGLEHSWPHERWVRLSVSPHDLGLSHRWYDEPTRLVTARFFDSPDVGRFPIQSAIKTSYGKTLEERNQGNHVAAHEATAPMLVGLVLP